MPCSLLNCLGRAAVKHGVRFLLDLVPGGTVVYDIAVEVYEEYRRQGQEDAGPARTLGSLGKAGKLAPRPPSSYL